MVNRSRRDALRGVEVETLDLIAEVLSSEKWAELLKGVLKRAVGQGNNGLTHKLVEAGAHMEDALHAAVGGGHGDVVNDLLANGASISSKHTECGRTPLHVAAQEGKPEMVQLLLLKGADKDAFSRCGFSPLFFAAHYGQVTSARALLAGDANVNLNSRGCGTSVAQAAARSGHVDILKAAIEHGADVDAVDKHQNTALHRAAEADEVEASKVLVEAGANIEARTDNGSTPLHSAADDLSLDTLAVLLKHGAHVNVRNIHNETPVFCAATKAGTGAAEVVDILLRAGADETITDRNGRSAADVVAIYVEEEQDRVAGDFERVRHLLANASADRAWRRRGYLALCRAHPGRVQVARRICRAHAGRARRTRSMARKDMCGWNETVRGGITDERVARGWVVLVAHVLELEEDGIFRTIVGYL